MGISVVVVVVVGFVGMMRVGYDEGSKKAIIPNELRRLELAFNAAGFEEGLRVRCGAVQIVG